MGASAQVATLNGAVIPSSTIANNCALFRYGQQIGSQHIEQNLYQVDHEKLKEFYKKRQQLKNELLNEPEKLKQFKSYHLPIEVIMEMNPPIQPKQVPEQSHDLNQSKFKRISNRQHMRMPIGIYCSDLHKTNKQKIYKKSRTQISQINAKKASIAAKPPKYQNVSELIFSDENKIKEETENPAFESRNHAAPQAEEAPTFSHIEPIQQQSVMQAPSVAPPPPSPVQEKNWRTKTTNLLLLKNNPRQVQTAQVEHITVAPPRVSFHERGLTPPSVKGAGVVTINQTVKMDRHASPVLQRPNAIQNIQMSGGFMR